MIRFYLRLINQRLKKIRELKKEIDEHPTMLLVLRIAKLEEENKKLRKEKT